MGNFGLEAAEDFLHSVCPYKSFSSLFCFFVVLFAFGVSSISCGTSPRELNQSLNLHLNGPIPLHCEK